MKKTNQNHMHKLSLSDTFIIRNYSELIVLQGCLRLPYNFHNGLLSSIGVPAIKSNSRSDTHCLVFRCVCHIHL